MASIRQVAKEAGVSIATVSRVMNGESTVAPQLRRQVMSVVERFEYVGGAGRRASDLIALVFAGPFTPGSPYDSACLEGMVEAMRETAHDLAIVDVRRDRLEGESFRQFFARKGICGAIVRCTASDRPLVAQMAADGFPLVVLGDHYADSPAPCVYASSAGASAEAVLHLLSLGHTRIAFAACFRDDGDHSDRYETYCRVMKDADKYDESLVFRIPPHRVDGAQLLRRMMALSQPPTSLYVADPYIAVGVLNEAHALGVVIPDQLSLVGFDDVDTRNSVHPRMTAVCQNSRMLGREAFDALMRLIQRQDVDSSSCAERQAAWLEIHETTAPPPESVKRVLAGRRGLRQRNVLEKAPADS